MESVVLNAIIGLNPTGTLDFNGTYKMNGINNIVRNSKDAAKDNLAKVNKNEVSCDLVENFWNEGETTIQPKMNIAIFILAILFLAGIIFILSRISNKKKYYVLI